MSDKPEPQPMSRTATGLFFRTPAGIMQRYGPAPGGAHWYAGVGDRYDGWHAYLETDVRTTKLSKKAERAWKQRNEKG